MKTIKFSARILKDATEEIPSPVYSGNMTAWSANLGSARRKELSSAFSVMVSGIVLVQNGPDTEVHCRTYRILSELKWRRSVSGRYQLWATWKRYRIGSNTVRRCADIALPVDPLSSYKGITLAEFRDTARKAFRRIVPDAALSIERLSRIDSSDF